MLRNTIVNKLNDGCIMSDYEICKSPADGHCFIYSVLSNLNSRVDPDNVIHYDFLVNALEKEVVDNWQFYVPFINGSSLDRLLDGMNAYVYHKKYDTPFGDMVPHIIANALKTPIVIVHRYVDTLGVSVVSQRGKHPSDINSYVLVFKTGKHYDGLTHVSCNSESAVLNGSIRDSNIIGNGENLWNDGYFSMTADSELETHGYTGREFIMAQRGHHNDNPRTRHVGPECVVDCNDSSDLCHTGLNILVWNINGLSQSKLDKRIAGSMLLKYDIILLCETWAAEDADFVLNGYTYHNYPRRYKHRSAKRHSGGIALFIRKTIQDGVTLGNYTNDTIAWVVLKKSFFRFPRDIYLACIYIVPEGSTNSTHDAFDLIFEQIIKIPNGNDVILCGDYNARTGSMVDLDINFTNRTNGDLNSLLPPECSERYLLIDKMYRQNLLERNNKDLTSNTFGSRLIELCRMVGLLILNGRIGSDKGIGDFTRDSTTGKSVVDYVLSSPRVFSLISEFVIHKSLPESDHKPISFTIFTAPYVATDASVTENIQWRNLTRYKWSREELANLSELMHDSYSDPYIQEFMESIAVLAHPNDVAISFDKYIAQACERTMVTETVKSHRPRNRVPWYDHECREKRSIAIKSGERVHSEIDRQNQRQACRDYKACKQRKQRTFHRKCIVDIEHAYFNNRASMWKLIEKMSNGFTNGIEPDNKDLYNHFLELSNPCNKPDFNIDYENSAIQFLAKYDAQICTSAAGDGVVSEIINQNFTEDEITECVNQLKNNKSPGIDGIASEFFKICKGTLVPYITEILNYIIEFR